MMALKAALILAAVFGGCAHTVEVRPHAQDSLLQTWNKALEGQGSGAKETPITRVVNLLKEMQGTLKKEMDEDEEMYEKLACWCNNNKYEKNQAIEAAEAKIASLESQIEALTSQSAELKTVIAETTAELAADKQELATATALRQKELKAFHGEELDAIQNVENLKAAIIVLGKHHAAFPQISLLALGSGHKNSDSPLDRQFDTFMRKNDYPVGEGEVGVKAADRAVEKFIQEQPKAAAVATASQGAKSIWSHQDEVVVSKAVHSASAFLQSHGRAAYNPGYSSSSGEILGIMKQLKEEMEADLSDGQKTETSRASLFNELREAKNSEIAQGEKMLEEKKAELAQADFDLANAKEDLEEVQAELSENQKFVINLTKTCAEADTNFELRKKSRIGEIQAVSQTIEILTSDEARDSMNGAYKFLQVEKSSKNGATLSSRRALAAQLLRNVAKKTGNPELSVLASSVELDAFTEVKKMIDEMIATLKVQQADEVKKKDWCGSELQENTMQTAKAEDLRTDQNTAIDNLNVAIKTLTDEMAAAKAQLADNQMNLQRASENRVKENAEFQKTVADQVATQEILAKALDKLATFYDKLFLVEVGRHSHKAAVHGKQNPPVAQAEYKPSGGASGVMSMIEKLIYDAKEMVAEGKKAEGEAQAQYEAFVADTNASTKELQKALVTKSENKAKAERELIETQEALGFTTTDLEDLATYNAGLHKDCDYILKNFGIRQESRAAEIEALQQAKQILSGAI